MPPDPHDPLDREDAPFLTSDTENDNDNNRTDDYGYRESKQYQTDHDEPSASAKKVRFRFMVTLFAMVLAVEVGYAMSNGPMTRIYESIACREYYSNYDPSQIGSNGQVPEELCKIKEVQSELAAVKGYMEFFDGILSAFLAIPYGLLADRIGRKPIIRLSVPAFFLNSIITFIVLWYSDIFPLRAVWASSLAWFFGGGPVVAFAIIWTMMSDVTSEDERASMFFRIGVVGMGADFVSSAVSSWMMTFDAWLPLLLGWAIVLIGILFAFSLPETMKVSSSRRPVRTPSVELSQLAPENGEHKETSRKNSLQQDDLSGTEDFNGLQGEQLPFTPHTTRKQPFLTMAYTRSRSYLTPYSFIFRNRQIMLLLTAFLVYRLSRGSSWFLVQYISARYNWTLAQANLLMSFKPALTIPLFLFVLPGISRVLLRSMKTNKKDLYLARASIIFLCVGTLGIGLSPSVAMLIPSLILQTSGSGFVFVTRSLVTTLVEKEETARLFTIIEVLQAVGNVIASLSITNVFQVGLAWGGSWIGLAWMMTSTAFALVGLAIWSFKLPPSSKNVKPADIVGF